MKSARAFFPIADFQPREGVNLRRLENIFDIDLLGADRVLLAAEAELQSRYSHLIVNVRIGPDAGPESICRRRLLAANASIGLFDDFNHRANVLRLVSHQRSIHFHIVLKPGFGQHLFQFPLNLDGAKLRRRADIEEQARPVRGEATVGHQNRVIRQRSTQFRDREIEELVQEIVDRTGLHQSVVSRHLSFLKVVGLLQVRKQNNMKFYSLSPDAVQYLQKTIDMFALTAPKGGLR